MKHRRIPRTSLDAAFARVSREKARVEQNSLCLYCHCRLTAKTATREHRTARFNGGTDAQANIGASCESCNKTKGHLSEGEFKNRIKRPKPGDNIHFWLAWSRRRINLAVDRMDRRVARYVGRPA